MQGNLSAYFKKFRGLGPSGYQKVQICMNDVVKHWPSYHYAVTHMHNENSNIQGRSPYVVK